MRLEFLPEKFPSRISREISYFEYREIFIFIFRDSRISRNFCRDPEAKSGNFKNNSDGASVMVKYGTLSPAHHQLCYNHAIHLAIMRIFYEKKTVFIEPAESESEVEANSEPDDYDSDDPDETSNVPNIMSMNMGINTTFSKMRKIIKIFKRSPVRNSLLQENIKQIATEHHELQLLLDCKTRWNTIEKMVERFLKVRPAIEKTLNELNMQNLWSAEDDMIAANILKTIQPVKKAVEALSRQDANLLTAEGILKFLFKALQKINSEISIALLSELKKEINNRRDKHIVSLFKVLNNPGCFKINGEDDFFILSSKTQIISTAKVILKRLFELPAQQPENPTSEPDFEEVLTDDLDNDLESSIRNCVEPSKVDGLVDNNISINAEFNFFFKTEVLTKNLSKLKNGLALIKPTSTQNERNFSTSGNFCTKIRNRLSDKSIDALCILKHYFLSN